MEYRTVEDPDAVADAVIVAKIAELLQERLSTDMGIDQTTAAIELRAAAGMEPDGALDSFRTHLTERLSTIDARVERLASKLRTPLGPDSLAKLTAEHVAATLPTYEQEHIRLATLHRLEQEDNPGAETGYELTLLWHEVAVSALHARA